MISNTVLVPAVATSVYDLIRIYLSSEERSAVDDHNQQLKFNILFQVRSTNGNPVFIGDSKNQDYALVVPVATQTNQYEFNKQSITDLFVRGSLGDRVTIVLLPCSN